MWQVRFADSTGANISEQSIKRNGHGYKHLAGKGSGLRATLTVRRAWR
jgi:hypothetical protein